MKAKVILIKNNKKHFFLKNPITKNQNKMSALPILKICLQTFQGYLGK